MLSILIFCALDTAFADFRNTRHVFTQPEFFYKPAMDSSESEMSDLHLAHQQTIPFTQKEEEKEAKKLVPRERINYTADASEAAKTHPV